MTWRLRRKKLPTNNKRLSAKITVGGQRLKIVCQNRFLFSISCDVGSRIEILSRETITVADITKLRTI